MEDLAAALARQDSSAQLHGTPNGTSAGPSEAGGGVKERPTHQLMKALAVMEDHVAASIDPDRLTGVGAWCEPGDKCGILKEFN